MGWSNSMVGKALAFHTADRTLISGIPSVPYGPLNPTGVIPEHRARYKHNKMGPRKIKKQKSFHKYLNIYASDHQSLAFLYNDPQILCRQVCLSISNKLRHASHTICQYFSLYVLNVCSNPFYLRAKLTIRHFRNVSFPLGFMPVFIDVPPL